VEEKLEGLRDRGRRGKKGQRKEGKEGAAASLPPASSGGGLSCSTVCVYAMSICRNHTRFSILKTEPIGLLQLQFNAKGGRA